DVSCDPQSPIERWSANWPPAIDPVSGAEPSSAVEPTLDPAFQEGDDRASILGIAQIIELILKDRPRLDRLARSTPQRVDLASRLLAISLISFALYGLAMSLTFFAAQLWPQLASTVRWLNGSEPQL